MGVIPCRDTPTLANIHGAQPHLGIGALGRTAEQIKGSEQFGHFDFVPQTPLLGRYPVNHRQAGVRGLETLGLDHHPRSVDQAGRLHGRGVGTCVRRRHPRHGTASLDRNGHRVRQDALDARGLDLGNGRQGTLGGLEIERENIEPLADARSGQRLLATHHAVGVHLHNPHFVVLVLGEKIFDKQIYTKPRHDEQTGKKQSLAGIEQGLLVAAAALGLRRGGHLQQMLAAPTADRTTAARFFTGEKVHGCWVVRLCRDNRAIFSHSPRKLRPATAAALGRRLVSVMPGIVLASRTNGMPSDRKRMSTRE